MAASIPKRRIELIFSLGTGTFGTSGADQVKVNGLRVRATVTVAGGLSKGAAQLLVYGLPQSTMNALSTLGLRLIEQRRNSVVVLAGDEGGGMPKVFEGTIQQGWVDYNQMPDTVFNVTAFPGLFYGIKPASPVSYAAGTPVSTIMQTFATQMNLNFENNGVTAVLGSNAYWPMTTWDQAQACAETANINWTIERGVLAIWPKGGVRASTVPTISAKSGLVGYPTYTQYGITVKTIYNPALKFGAQINVQSALAPASGIWNIATLTHHLEAEAPGGDWTTEMECLRPGTIAIPGAQ